MTTPACKHEQILSDYCPHCGQHVSAGPLQHLRRHCGQRLAAIETERAESLELLENATNDISRGRWQGRIKSADLRLARWRSYVEALDEVLEGKP